MDFNPIFLQLAMLFSMQGFGRLLCNLVLIVLLQNDETAYDYNWRMAVSYPSHIAILGTESGRQC